MSNIRRINFFGGPCSGKSTTSSWLFSKLKECDIKGMELASTLDVSKLSNIEEWISTGSYALNKVISGSYYKGLPRGRIVSLGGSSGVGKSFICGCCMREAQKMGYKVIVFDSENAIDKDFLGRIGVDVSEVLLITVNTVGDVKLKGIQLMRKFHEKYPDEKMFIVIDSIGNLMTEKEFNTDIEANKDVSDMGLRAKQLRVLAKAFTHEVARTKSAMIVTNHTYEKPNPYNPALPSTTVMNGGEGFVYSTSAIIFLKKYLEKEEEKDSVSKKNKKVITGAKLIAHTEKNRFVPQGAEAEIYLSFEKGMNKWYGMLSDAMEHGFVEQGGAWYTVKNEKGEGGR
jgi:recombination protein RecA